MKKTADSTTIIMDRIVQHESDRIRIIRIVFLCLTVLFSAGLIFSALVVIRQLIEGDSFSLLALFREDTEIIREYWYGTIVTFWDEMPQAYVYFGILVLLIGLGYGMGTWKLRQKIRIKEMTIHKYRSEYMKRGKT